MYAITTKGGTSNYKLIKIDLRKPDVANATVLIPEKEKLIQSMAISKDYLLLVYSDGINGYLYKMNLSDEKLINVKLQYQAQLAFIIWTRAQMNL